MSKKWGLEVGKSPLVPYFFRTRSQLHFLHLLFEMHVTQANKDLLTYLDIYNVCSGVAKMYDGLCTLSSSLTICVVFPSLKKRYICYLPAGRSVS